jgi:hypothetical protein
MARLRGTRPGRAGGSSSANIRLMTQKPLMRLL